MLKRKVTGSKEKKSIQMRNSSAEFLIFTSQAGDNTIEVRVKDETDGIFSSNCGTDPKC